MLAALDALIQNGTGGRRTLVLRQICSLFMKVGHVGEKATTALFDEVMANLAVDLDDTVVIFLEPELQQISGILPAFKSTIASRAHEIRARTSAVPVLQELIQHEPIQHELLHEAKNPEKSSALQTALDEKGPQPATAEYVQQVDRAIQTPPGSPPYPPAERRAEPRDPVLDANNPVTLARRASPGELMQIASVAHLPETLTSVIVMRGDRQAIVRALQNPTARFARSSLTMLAELAPSDLMIKQGLIQRDDLPEVIIERMLPYLNTEAKARVLLSGALFNDRNAQTALEQANADLVNAYRQGQILTGVDGYLTAVEEARMSTGDVVVSLAADLRVAELALFASRRLGFGFTAAMNLLAGRLDKGAAVLAAALQCERQATTAIMDMRRRCGVMPDARGAIEVYLRIATDEALMLVLQIDRLSIELQQTALVAIQDDMLEKAA